MKKVIFGSIMFLSGLVSCAILLAGAMTQEWTIDGSYSFIFNLSQYGLMPITIVFIIIAIIGLAIGLWGVIEKNKQIFCTIKKCYII